MTHRCEDLIALLTEYVEGGLPPAQARAFEAELTGCASCRGLFETIGRTRDAVRRLRCEQIPADCHRRLRVFLDHGRAPRDA